MTGSCQLCGRYGPVELHHLIGGAYRRKADRDGLVIFLCPGCHRLDPWAAHRSGETMRELRALGQRIWMERTGKGVRAFVKEYGKNYLGGEP